VTREDVEMFLKDRIRAMPVAQAAGKLGLLPIGVEVVLARPWSADECEGYANLLGWTVVYDVVSP